MVSRSLLDVLLGTTPGWAGTPGESSSDEECWKAPRAAERAGGRRLGLGFPMLVDTIGDAVGARYSGMPSRLYLIDRDGKVAYKSDRGPFGFKPAELEHSRLLLLRADRASSGDRPADREPADRAEGSR